MTPEQEKLITDNIKLVYFVYTKYFMAKDGGREKDDLISEGMIGLINASNKYDSSRSSKFATFACVCIWQQMCKYLRDNKARLTAGVVSLDAEIKISEGTSITMKDVIGGGEEDLITEKQIFDELVLSDKEREVLKYKYMGYTQEEIAGILGISRQRVNRIIDTARDRYRRGGKVVNKQGRPKKHK